MARRNKTTEEVVQPIVQEEQPNAWVKPTIPQADIPDATKLPIIEELKQANQELKFQDNISSPISAQENMYMDAVIQRAKSKGGLTAENIQQAQKDLSVPRQTFSALENDITLEKETPKPEVTEEEQQTIYPEDWMMTYKKINPKPNVLSDLGLAGYENYNVPDDLLNYSGKNLNTAIDQITDKDGNQLTDEQKKKILRRIRGVRAGDALMKIANITGQAVGVGMGGAPVAMDNVPILQRIGANAQAKQDAWIKQALKAKEQEDTNRYNMLKLGLDEKKLNMDLWDKQTKAQYNAAKLELDKLLAEHKINYDQYNMMLNAKKLEASIENNNRKNAIAQQNADTRRAKTSATDTLLKNYTHYRINGNDYVIPRNQIRNLAGYLVKAVTDDKNSKTIDPNWLERTKKYYEGENAQKTMNDARQSELFIADAIANIPSIITDILINKNLVTNKDISDAYLINYNQYGGYAEDYNSPIASPPIEGESEKESETDNDELEKRAN